MAAFCRALASPSALPCACAAGDATTTASPTASDRAMTSEERNVDAMEELTGPVHYTDFGLLGLESAYFRGAPCFVASTNAIALSAYVSAVSAYVAASRYLASNADNRAWRRCSFAL